MNSHDPELPRGFQDADLEMAEFQAKANHEAKLRKKGICAHGWLSSPPGKKVKCNDCGKEWDTINEAYTERGEILA